ncbi:GNAT family N-acetyltransferase [Chitinophaga deserti]|uniref:GNAT family N-acetyltransferase n=1 Tax=Chitinophaga deserti TaxID=2164099 RepID=UPI000D6AD827|nr:GNAT family N-acetyltransferase [Chitinophaga deserti]
MIRPATPDDAPVAVPLLFLAMEEIARKLSGTNDMQVVTHIFEHLFRERGNQYSYENALIFEGDKGPAGMILGYDGGKLHDLRKPVLDYIRWQTGAGICPEDETQPGEYYLDSIAVAPGNQGKGIGSRLIGAATQKAATEGMPRAGLLVSTDNPAAQRLYERMGFKVEYTIPFAGGRYHHLVKNLQEA